MRTPKVATNPKAKRIKRVFSSSHEVFHLWAKVETTSHAHVDLSVARSAFAAILDGTLKHGDKVGEFEFDCIEPDESGQPLIKIGCHRISLEHAKAVLRGGLRLVAADGEVQRG